MKESHPDQRMHPRLAEKMRQQQGAPVPIPARVDDRIRRGAERHLAGQQAGWSGWRLMLAVWKQALHPRHAVAILVMALGIGGFFLMRNDSGRHTAAPVLAHQVTVVDALQLARALETGDQQSLRDVNGDGAINRQDVEALMQQAVKL